MYDIYLTSSLAFKKIQYKTLTEIKSLKFYLHAEENFLNCDKMFKLTISLIKSTKNSITQRNALKSKILTH